MAKDDMMTCSVLFWKIQLEVWKKYMNLSEIATQKRWIAEKSFSSCPTSLLSVKSNRPYLGDLWFMIMTDLNIDLKVFKYKNNDELVKGDQVLSDGRRIILFSTIDQILGDGTFRINCTCCILSVTRQEEGKPGAGRAGARNWVQHSPVCLSWDWSKWLRLSLL